jgi:hypothetical protein
VGLLCFKDTVLLYLCVCLHISMSFSLFPSCSLFLGLSLSLLLSLSTGKVFSGQKLIKIGGKDVVGLDNSDIAVLILGAPGESSKYMYLCMHVCMGGVVCMFVCARACECVSRGFQKNRHQCYVSMWVDSIAALVASEL